MLLSLGALRLLLDLAHATFAMSAKFWAANLLTFRSSTSTLNFDSISPSGEADCYRYYNRYIVSISYTHFLSFEVTELKIVMHVLRHIRCLASFGIEFLPLEHALQ